MYVNRKIVLNQFDLITFACKRCNFIVLQWLTITRVKKLMVYLNNLSTRLQLYKITTNMQIQELFVNHLFVLDDYSARRNEFKRADRVWEHVGKKYNFRKIRCK